MTMISTRGRYALRVMIDLAERRSGAYIPLGEIARRQEISEKYLEAIIKSLVRAGLVQGLRGKGGGYRLTRPPEACTVGDILRLTEGPIAPVACLNGAGTACDRAAECRTLPMWRKLEQMLNEYFDGITLADLARPELDGNEYSI